MSALSKRKSDAPSKPRSGKEPRERKLSRGDKLRTTAEAERLTPAPIDLATQRLRAKGHGSERAFLTHGPGADPLAEELGREFLESATSGQESTAELRDEEVPEERGGPFIETEADEEFADGTDGANPEDAEREPFPRV